MKNILTVDLEDWHQSILTILPGEWGNYEKRVEYSTLKLLNILEQSRSKATFFILGRVAFDHPDLVREIYARGHEIGSHGYYHRPVYEQTKQDFSKDLERSVRVLESITGEQVTAYRAPWFSITLKSLWALDILVEHGIKYDASIFPVKTNFYGIHNAPRYPYIIKRKHGFLVEFPPATLQTTGLTLPAGGGFYLRVMPFFIIRRALEKMNRVNRPALVYIHPWELDTDQPRLNLNLTQKIIHYTCIRETEKKFCRLISEFDFWPLGKIANTLTGEKEIIEAFDYRTCI